ncbi:MAG: TonB-dependent receptor, partial [Flavobacteriaceae bacterium]|nr:TonB-dependent receptor [Flavobacteriaceae bacterium]
MHSFKVLAILLILILNCHGIGAQNKVTLSGKVTDAITNEQLIGVNVLVNNSTAGTITNEYGFYSITLTPGTYQFIVSYLGYAPINRTIDLTSNQTLNFQLEEAAEQLEEVVITEDVEKLNIRKPQMSVNTLSVSTIKQIPVVLGEVDIVKSLILLPGITNAGEGSSGFNVRGGAVDQNLILLDEATIFNSSHLFGFFSVFNPDAIKDIKLYKGGIPARYGGRVSSVLEIFQKEGNKNNLSVNGGIGLVASRLLVEGPIQKQKSSFLIGGRSSYAHLFLPLFDINNSAYFYDLNSKLNFELDKNNSLYFSGYFGRDVFSINDNFENIYGNAVLNFRWNHLFTDRIFSNLSLIYSDYYYGLELDFVGFLWNSGIQNFNLKYDFQHYLNEKMTLNYGLNNTYYSFNPGRIEPNSAESGIVEEQLTKKYANEAAVYASVEQEITPNLKVEYGLRVSSFFRLGQDEFYKYENEQPVIFDPFTLTYQEAEPVDTVNTRGEVMKDFYNFEPRVSVAYTINESSSIKASYTRLAQYLHLLSNTSSPTPLDVWTPSGPYVKPQLLDQYAIGYFRNLWEGDYSLEVETYYKDIQNRIDYIDGANLIANNSIERVILNGEARAYGLEILFRKNEGKFQGWLAYTLAKSEQRTPGRKPTFDNGRSNIETGINLGQWYNTPYDKTHDIALFGTYELNDKWTFGSNFVFQTGRPVNYPVAKFEFQDIVAPLYGLRNQQRLPDYHRLDLSATLSPKPKKEKRFKSEWVFSLYNV